MTVVPAWPDTLLQDLRHGARILRRAPRFTVAVVLILGLGVGMTAAVFAIADSLLLNAVPFAESHRLVQLNRWGPHGGGPMQPPAMVNHWRNETALFDRVEAYDPVERISTGRGGPETLPGARVSPGLLPLLGVAPRLGRLFAPDEAASAVGIISHVTWQTRFGGAPDVVGRTLRFSDRALAIVGVMPASFRFPDANAAFWEPFDAYRGVAGDLRPRYVSILARLRRDVSFEQADARVAVLAPQWNRDWGATGVTTRLTSLNQYAGLGIDDGFWWVQKQRAVLFLLFGAVACVLTIACANASNLFLSHAMSRGREFAIRAAAGAGRLRLCRQLLTESVLVALIAGVLGMAFAGWLIGLIAAAVPPDLRRELLNPIDLDRRVAAWAALAALLAGAATTVPAALRAVGGDLTGTLQGRGSRAVGGHGRLRGGLIAIQNALAVILLIGALLMARSLLTLFSVDIGWTAGHAIALEPQWSGARYDGAEARVSFLDRLADLIAAVPGVRVAAPAEQVPFIPGSLSFGTVETERADTPQTTVTINHVSNSYFRAAEIPILQGRGFAPDAVEQVAAIVSGDLADRLWPDEIAVGQRFRMPGLGRLHDGNWLTVVGVAGSVLTGGFELDRPDPYEIYLPWSSSDAGGSNWPRYVLVRTDGTGDPATAIKQQVWRLDPGLPVTLHVMDGVVETALAEPGFYTTLLAAFAVLAMLLAGAGLYAVVACETSARTKEIGVRVSLGATRGAVIRHVLGRAMLPCAAGTALGLPGALVLSGFLSPLLYQTAPTDPATFAAAVVFLLAAAAAGAWLPARRAARVDPMTALRAE